MYQLTKSSSESELKSYFNAVLELSKSDNKFPINLDDVWPLVYSRKDKDVKELKKNFFEKDDFITLPQKGEGGKFDRIDYYLSTSCLEYFIARKVRPVFEVYRKVFHKSVQVPTLPTTYKDALKQLLVEVEQKEQLQLACEHKDGIINLQSDELRRSAPKVAYYDNVLQSSQTYTIQQVAKELDTTAIKLYEFLKAQKVIFKQSGQWMLSARYHGKGYAKTRTSAFTRSDGSAGSSSYMVLTEAGREFVHGLFNNNN